MYASEYGKVECVRMMAGVAGVDLETRDDGGRSLEDSTR